jgi:hypothetical protein
MDLSGVMFISHFVKMINWFKSRNRETHQEIHVCWRQVVMASKISFLASRLLFWFVFL